MTYQMDWLSFLIFKLLTNNVDYIDESNYWLAEVSSLIGNILSIIFYVVCIVIIFKVVTNIIFGPAKSSDNIEDLNDLIGNWRYTLKETRDLIRDLEDLEEQQIINELENINTDTEAIDIKIEPITEDEINDIIKDEIDKIEIVENRINTVEDDLQDTINKNYRQWVKYDE